MLELLILIAQVLKAIFIGYEVVKLRLNVPWWLHLRHSLCREGPSRGEFRSRSVIDRRLDDLTEGDCIIFVAGLVVRLTDIVGHGFGG